MLCGVILECGVDPITKFWLCVRWHIVSLLNATSKSTPHCHLSTSVRRWTLVIYRLDMETPYTGSTYRQTDGTNAHASWAFWNVFPPFQATPFWTCLLLSPRCPNRMARGAISKYLFHMLRLRRDLSMPKDILWVYFAIWNLRNLPCCRRHYHTRPASAYVCYCPVNLRTVHVDGSRAVGLKLWNNVAAFMHLCICNSLWSKNHYICGPFLSVLLRRRHGRTWSTAQNYQTREHVWSSMSPELRFVLSVFADVSSPPFSFAQYQSCNRCELLHDWHILPVWKPAKMCKIFPYRGATMQFSYIWCAAGHNFC